MSSTRVNISRNTIIDMMTSQEKEVFEKYKDIYPFPIRKFIKEIGINLIEKKAPKFCAERGEENGQPYMKFLWQDEPKDHRSFALGIMLINFFVKRFYETDEDLNQDAAYSLVCEFLMPREVLFETISEKLAEHFGIPTGAVNFYMNYFYKSPEQIKLDSNTKH